MRRLLPVIAMAAVMLIPAGSASAALTGEQARFNKCPLNNLKVEACVYAESSGGSFTLGKKSVPVKNAVVLQGGVEALTEEGVFGPTVFLAPTSGDVISKTPQPVPGGLLGIQAPNWWPQFLRDLFNETINNGFTGVNSTVELAGPASSVKVSFINALSQQGAAFSMPVKVKLSNPFLGNNCYIGSNSNPIQLNLTTGKTSPPPPNTSITGSPGEPGELPAMLLLKNNRLVDNAFAAPGANGCGGLFSFLIDPFVNSIVGVPSPAGSNTAILEGTTYLGIADQLREML